MSDGNLINDLDKIHRLASPIGIDDFMTYLFCLYDLKSGYLGKLNSKMITFATQHNEELILKSLEDTEILTHLEIIRDLRDIPQSRRPDITKLLGLLLGYPEPADRKKMLRWAVRDGRYRLGIKFTFNQKG